MTRLRMVLALGIACLVGALVTGRDMFYQLTYAIVLMLLLSLFWAWTGVGWLRFSRKTHVRRAQVGQPIEERLAVRNMGRLPKLWLEVDDHSDLPGYTAGKGDGYDTNNNANDFTAPMTSAPRNSSSPVEDHGCP